jgi:hypothetical protein
MQVRKTANDIAFGLVAAHNQRQLDAIASFFHLGRTESTSRTDYRAPTVTRVTVSAANGTDLATNITLVNEIKADYNLHAVDADAHNTAVSAVVATATATDEATAITLANALKAAYNTHLSASNVHFTNDSTNVVSAANATDLATLQTLVNEMKGDLNAHMASAPAGSIISLIDP